MSIIRSILLNLILFTIIAAASDTLRILKGGWI